MHTALYRKRRPKTFGDIIGQPHVVQSLENQLETGQLSHAYLFCGTRGTGKTSAARIFARAANCLAPQSNGPCNTCDICENILAERSMDVIEIDAASNNSVDNIRDLREEVRYPPTHATRKVYIIDEVHMLSGSAFNALLKTLEEPPPHVIFILATTDPQKIPATILSRCQRYDFKRITAPDMIQTMARYLQEENTPYEEAALGQIAYHSDGAMRDALSLLDQSLAIGEGVEVTLPNVLQLLGAVDRQVLFDITNALATQNSAKILEIIAEAMTQGRDVSQLTNDLIRHFRDVLVASQGAELDYSAEIKEKLTAQGKSIQTDKLVEYIHAFSETLRELRFAPHMRTALEVCALRLCSPDIVAGDANMKGQTQGTGKTAGKQGTTYAETNPDALRHELEGLQSRLAKLEQQLAGITNNSTVTLGTSTQPQHSTQNQEAEALSSTANIASTTHQSATTNETSATHQSATAHQTSATHQAPASHVSAPSQAHATSSSDNTASQQQQPTPQPNTTLSGSPTPPQQDTSTPQLLSQIQAGWKSLCNTLPPMLRSMLIRCKLEFTGGTLEIICDNESEAKILKDKNRPLLIREALAEQFNLSTPPNLAFIVREAYNKSATNEPKPPMPVTRPASYTDAPQQPTHEPTKPTPPPQPEQLGWDDYAQGIESNDSPF